MSDPKVDEIIRLHECMKQRDTRIERLEAALRYCRMEMIGMGNRAGDDAWLEAVASRGISKIDAALAPQEETQ